MNKGRVVPALILGLTAISFASILIKLCTAPALIIAFYRLSLAAVFYWGLARIKNRPVWQSLDGKQKKLTVLSGLFLAAHFAFWITSLEYTSVASSVVLVQSAPVFVVIGSMIFLKERPTFLMLIGIAVALAGAIVISAADFRAEHSSLIGNILAMSGALAIAGYLLIGRKLRPRIDTMIYVSVVYTSAAIVTFFLAVLSGNSFFHYNVQTFVFLAAIAFVPQVIGHTSFNWALKYFSAATVSIVALGEPIGASILALIILGERLTLLKILGGGVIIAGLCAVLISETREYNNI